MALEEDVMDDAELAELGALCDAALPEHIGRGLKATSHTLSATLVQSEGCRA